MREVWFTDRYGSEIEDDITLEHLASLLSTVAIPDGDEEHRNISVSDSDEWNLEFYPNRVLFENVDEDGEEVGNLRGLSEDERLAVADEFIRGDFDALRAHPWSD